MEIISQILLPDSRNFVAYTRDLCKKPVGTYPDKKNCYLDLQQIYMFPRHKYIPNGY